MWCVSHDNFKIINNDLIINKVWYESFLGGTCNESVWRDELMPLLESANIDYFNPVVDAYQRKNCDICLYTITPKMTGVYSIAEVVDDSNKQPEKAILCVLKKAEGDSFEEHQVKSLDNVAKMVTENGSKAFSALNDLVAYLKELDAKKSDFGLLKSL